ncbi:ADP-ribosylation factor GTPase-activating protein AGD7-like [Iris pallida]|uniref:ADP-ribosylation factor GTPase-activating protein AGD7-like n=1 Tax=Iris pallida TaxID=29817 RepID=A0AAX6I8I8_IRIPA|nr:ADP-ribosylation factor GTPase-activating protein AGD7-like [Iris pallida]
MYMFASMGVSLKMKILVQSIQVLVYFLCTTFVTKETMGGGVHEEDDRELEPTMASNRMGPLRGQQRGRRELEPTMVSV